MKRIIATSVASFACALLLSTPAVFAKEKSVDGVKAEATKAEAAPLVKKSPESPALTLKTEPGAKGVKTSADPAKMEKTPAATGEKAAPGKSSEVKAAKTADTKMAPALPVVKTVDAKTVAATPAVKTAEAKTVPAAHQAKTTPVAPATTPVAN